MQKTPREWELLQRIKTRVQRRNSHTVVPIGDDAFVFKNFKGLSVIAQDMMVEDIHFRRENSSAADLGHKALAVNLSDLAAMGATPHWIQVSLALPKDLNESWLDEFYNSMCALADLWHAEIVGGDLCASPHSLVIDVSVYGSCDKPLTRSGVQPGDLLLCSGPLGVSFTGLLALEKKLPHYETAKNLHLRPRARLDLVPHLEKHSAHVHALMDCSDGLVNDALILCRGEWGLHIDFNKIHIHTDTKKLAEELKMPVSDFVLWGGEDYQLLMAVSPKDRDLFPQWMTVGEFNTSKQITYSLQGEHFEVNEFKGWSHFSK